MNAKLASEIDEERKRIREIYGEQHHTQGKWLMLLRNQLNHIEIYGNPHRQLVQLMACTLEWLENNGI